MNKVFVVLVEYTDFEDVDNNYSEARIVTKDWNVAVDKVIQCCEEQIEDGDMKIDIMLVDITSNGVSHTPMEFDEYIKRLITKFGYVALVQQVGNGKCRIILEEMEMI